MIQDREPVTDADIGRSGGAEQPVQFRFGSKIDGARRFVEEDELRPRYQDPREGDALLLAKRQDPRPVADSRQAAVKGVDILCPTRKTTWHHTGGGFARRKRAADARGELSDLHAAYLFWPQAL